MPFFAVRYTYIDDAGAIETVRPEHREYLRGLAEAGSLRASGPFVGVSPAGALLLFETGSVAEVERTLAHDPFLAAGIVAATEITPWDPVIGVFAQR